jgi:hypothetical protein
MSDNVSLFRALVRVHGIADSNGLSYVEMNRLLYSSDTFILLQNGRLWGLKSIVLPERFALLCFVHVQLRPVFVARESHAAALLCFYLRTRTAAPRTNLQKHSQYPHNPHSICRSPASFVRFACPECSADSAALDFLCSCFGTND